MFAALKSFLGLKQYPEFTREEIAKHNTPDSVWIVAGDRVFDVTEFVQLHPAGPLAIMKRAGGCTDCSRDHKFHSQGAREQWTRCQIGVLSASEMKAPIPACAAPDLTAFQKPKSQPQLPPTMPVVPGAARVTTVTSPSPALSPDDEGGEDAIGEGRCCRGGAPTEICKSCPHAPRCVRKKRLAGVASSAPIAAPSDVRAQQVGSDEF